ncbi:MAG: hypothetical protein AAGG81_07535 [Chlamydiota bacterium]
MGMTPMGSDSQASSGGNQSKGLSHQETVSQGQYAANIGGLSDNQNVSTTRGTKGKSKSGKRKSGEASGGESTTETSGKSTLGPANKKQTTGAASKTQTLQSQTAGAPTIVCFMAGQSQGQQKMEPNSNLNAGSLVNLLNNGFNVKADTGGMSLNVIQLPDVVDSEGGAELSLHDDEDDPTEDSTSPLAGTALFSSGLGSNVYVAVVRLNDDEIDNAKYDVTILTGLKMDQGFSLQDLANGVEDKMDDAAKQNLQGATSAFIFTTVGNVAGTVAAGGSWAAYDPNAPAASQFASHLSTSLGSMGSASGQFIQSVDRSKAEVDQATAQRIQASMKTIEQAESGTAQSINADNELVASSLQQILQELKNLGVNIR